MRKVILVLLALLVAAPALAGGRPGPHGKGEPIGGRMNGGHGHGGD